MREVEAENNFSVRGKWSDYHFFHVNVSHERKSHCSAVEHYKRTQGDRTLFITMGYEGTEICHEILHVVIIIALVDHQDC